MSDQCGLVIILFSHLHCIVDSDCFNINFCFYIPVVDAQVACISLRPRHCTCRRHQQYHQNSQVTSYHVMRKILCSIICHRICRTSLPTTMLWRVVCCPFLLVFLNIAFHKLPVRFDICHSHRRFEQQGVVFATFVSKRCFLCSSPIVCRT